MAKMEKSAMPAGHGPNDFKCFGPPATKDGEFDGINLVDMGCFKQDEVDSNKYYFAAVVQSKKDNRWYTYFEWGRIGATSPQFQMEEFGSQAQAQEGLAEQCHSKNDKRGEWKTVGGIRTLVAKPGKDVYKVQNLQSRSTGLPDAKNITSSAGLDASKIKKAIDPSAPVKPKKTYNIDPQTAALLKDMRVGAITYTRSSVEGGNIPTQTAIDHGRTITDAAKRRLPIVGDDIDAQINDRIIRQLSFDIKSLIPKVFPRGAPAKDWVLSKDNIARWEQDFDAFEAAIYANVQEVTGDENPYGDLPINMEWVTPASDLGKFLYGWVPHASANRHAIGPMAIRNVWKVARHGDNEIFVRGRDKCRTLNALERPSFQPPTRSDLTRDELKTYVGSNVGLLFHGTRTVNVSGILRTNLRFPKDLPPGVVITGAMFGPGAYFADDWRKSAGYTSLRGSYWSQGAGDIKGRSAFMFLMDVALGTPYVAPGPHGYSQPPKGHHCVFGKAKVSQVQNNEWIVFDRDQIQIKYLVEFDTK